MDRQLYPDALRAISLGRIVIFHFFGWQLLTYFPSLGVMFALGGWFIALSLNERPVGQVLIQRLGRLLPTWWLFALLSLIAGLFFARGAGIELQPTLAWFLPLERVTWNLDNAVANDATVVTWYIAAYIWLLLLSPLLLTFFKRLSWVLVFGWLFAFLAYVTLVPDPHETLRGETAFNVLTFGACWLLGFAKATGKLDELSSWVKYVVFSVLALASIGLTYEELSLTGNPTAQALLSFGTAFLLLSFNPSLGALPSWSKGVIRFVNTYAVTIYLFHNILIDASFEVGAFFHAYEVAGAVGLPELSSQIGGWICFGWLLVLLYIACRALGIIETRNWLGGGLRAPIIHRSKERHEQAVLS